MAESRVNLSRSMTRSNCFLRKPASVVSREKRKRSIPLASTLWIS